MVQLLDLLFPHFCVGCGKIGGYFCSLCKKKIRYIETSETICPVCERGAIDGLTHPKCRKKHTLDGLVSVFHYDLTVQKAIKEIKYRFVSDIVSDLVQMIGKESYLGLKRLCASSDRKVLVPIPLHTERQRFRGFNQAFLLGSHIGQQLDISVVSDMLIRTRKTIPQVETKDREERLQNMKNVFEINQKYDKNLPQSVILIDDVFTTGATVSSACKLLKQNGVKSVVAFTIAR